MTQRGMDKTRDEAWEPVWCPYQGKAVPCWEVTEQALLRMELAARADGEQPRPAEK